MSIPARPLVVLFCSLVLALWAGAANAQGWVPVRPGDGKYSIDMPSLPKETKQTAMTAAGPTELHQFAVEIGKSEAFVTTYGDFPAGSLKRPPATLMSEIENTVVSGMKGGKLRSHQVIALGPYPGRAFTIDLPDGTVYDQRVYFVGSRLYQNIAVTTGERTNDPRVKYFFDSFKLLKP
jgi:hypothetical protein